MKPLPPVAALVLGTIIIAMMASTTACRKADPAPPVIEPSITIEKLIDAVINNDAEFQDLSFATLIQSTTGKAVLPADESNPACAVIFDAITTALDETLIDFNRADSPTNEERRINEVSTHFENALQTRLDAMDGISCSFPPTQEGTTYRTGYPGLRILHQETGTITYLDPRLVSEGTFDSTARTFSYTAKSENNKILDDATHLLVGIEHDGNTGAWKFTNWKLVDLSQLKIRLKTEFSTGNRELYQADNIIRAWQNQTQQSH